MSVSYRVEPGDTSDYDGIVRMFHEAIYEFVYKTGEYPSKIVVTQPLYVILNSLVREQYNSFIYATQESDDVHKPQIMGISMDVIISREYYFMLGDPIQFPNPERGE